MVEFWYGFDPKCSIVKTIRNKGGLFLKRRLLTLALLDIFADVVVASVREIDNGSGSGGWRIRRKCESEAKAIV